MKNITYREYNLTFHMSRYADGSVIFFIEAESIDEKLQTNGHEDLDDAIEEIKRMCDEGYL